MTISFKEHTGRIIPKQAELSYMQLPFHILLTVKFSQSNKITLPKESTNAAKLPKGDTTTDKTVRLLSGILESIGKSLNRSSAILVFAIGCSDCCSWFPHPNQPLNVELLDYFYYQTETMSNIPSL